MGRSKRRTLLLKVTNPYICLKFPPYNDKLGDLNNAERGNMKNIKKKKRKS